MVTSYIYKSSAVAETDGHLATVDMRRNVGDAVGDLGPPSNTVWTGPRPTSIPSGILIHPTAWPQYTNVTDRQTTVRNLSKAQHYCAIAYSVASPGRTVCTYAELRLSIFLQSIAYRTETCMHSTLRLNNHRISSWSI